MVAMVLMPKHSQSTWTFDKLNGGPMAFRELHSGWGNEKGKKSQYLYCEAKSVHQVQSRLSDLAVASKSQM
jgi:hypothetical protein